MASASGLSSSPLITDFDLSETHELVSPSSNNQSHIPLRLTLAAKSVFETDSEGSILLSNVAAALKQVDLAKLTEASNGSDSLNQKLVQLIELLNNTTIDTEIKEQAVKQLTVGNIEFLPSRIDRAIIILNASSLKHANHLTEIYQLMNSRSLELFHDYQNHIPTEKKKNETNPDEWTLVFEGSSASLTDFETYREERISPTYFSIRYAIYLFMKVREGKAEEINLQDIKDAIGKDQFEKICSDIQTKGIDEVTTSEIIKAMSCDELASLIAAHLCPADVIHVPTTTPPNEVKIHKNHNVTISRNGKESKIKPSDLAKINLSNLPPHTRSLLIEKAFSNSKADTKESIYGLLEHFALFSKQFHAGELYKIDLKRKCLDTLNDPKSSSSKQFIEYISEFNWIEARLLLPLLKIPEEKAKCIEVMLKGSSLLSEYQNVIDEKLIHLIAPEVLEMCPQKVVLASLEAICKHKPNECSTKAVEILLKLKLEGSPQCYSDAVSFAVGFGNHAVLEVLYRIPELPDSVRKSKRFSEGYPELAAIQYNQLECLQIILKATNVSLTDYRSSYGCGALFYFAAQSKDTKCLKYLLEQPSTEFRSLAHENYTFLRDLGRVGSSSAIKLIARYPAFRELNHAQKAAMSGRVIDRFGSCSDENQYLDNCEKLKDRVTPCYHTKTKLEIENLTYQEKRLAFLDFIQVDDLKRLQWLVESVKPKKLAEELDHSKIVDALFLTANDSNSIEIIKVLEKEGVDIFDHRKSIIMTACIRSTKEVVAFLCTRFKDEHKFEELFTLKNIQGNGLAHLAVSQNNIGALTALLECDPYFATVTRSIPQSRDSRISDEVWKQVKACANDTPLMKAARMDPANQQILQLLIKYSRGVFFSASSQGMDAFAIAVNNNNIEAAKVFKEEYEQNGSETGYLDSDKKMSEAKVVGLLESKSTWHVFDLKSNFSEMKKTLASMIQRHSTDNKDTSIASSQSKTKRKQVASASRELGKPGALAGADTDIPLQDL